MKYQPIIGLEIHVQLNTKSKMFCSCSTNYFGKEPNTNTCPTCLGLPGALPAPPNKDAIAKVIKTGLAFNCNIAKKSKFDRKNYFYPDLPKGYQISQYDMPLCESGWSEILVHDDKKKIRIRRIHLEEDTAKTIYDNDSSLVDYNKSSIPLMEIVTEPDFEDSEEVLIFAKQLKSIVKSCDASDANMEKGHIRFELNISLKKPEDKGLPDYKIEVKNIGSISFLKKAIDYEIERQSEILDKGETPVQETRGYKDSDGTTYSQRTKEEENDYRYFPEPDIPPLVIDQNYIDSLKNEIPELEYQKVDRYLESYNLPLEIAQKLAGNTSLSVFFDSIIKQTQDKEIVSESAKWLVGDIKRVLKTQNKKIDDTKIAPETLIELIVMLKSNRISGRIMKDVLEESILNNSEPLKIIKEKDLTQISDDSEIEKLINEVFEENPQIKEDVFKNPNSKGFIVGQVMKKTKGQANPQKVDEVINRLLLRNK